MSTDYPILGAPTISLQAFTNVLRSAGSPIGAEAQGVYNAYVAHGVNPAIGLAIAQHESGYGKAGIAVGRDNPYGLRYYAGSYAGAVNAGGWAKFTSYTAAANAHAGLLASSGYGRSAHYNTARTFAYRYAPSKDHNNPTAYGSAVVASLQRWGAGKGIDYTPSKTAAKAPAKPTPSHPVHPAVGYAKAHPHATGAAVGIGGALLLALII